MKPLILLIFFCTIIFTGCSNDKKTVSLKQNKPNPFCEETLSYNDTVDITGNAQYQARLQGNGPIGPAKPIRLAEIEVTSSNNSTVQCGSTDISGNFLLKIPRGYKDLTIKIKSRSETNQSNIYVLNNPDLNTAYALTKTFDADESISIGTLSAQVEGEMLGAAFNILDQIIEASIFLKTKSIDCDQTLEGCVQFAPSSLPRLDAYWQKGFNPGCYISATGSPLSFYLADEYKLFILGGVDLSCGTNGDVDSTDTDHFDNSIILHEFAHYVEDVLFKSDSPGGQHDGTRVIDPRLAWSEAMANFLQAAVLDTPIYRDTEGSPLGETSVIFNENLEVKDATSKDLPTSLGEGGFREFSISRLLWDLYDSDNEGPGIDEVSDNFLQIWSLFTSPTKGHGGTTIKHKSAFSFHKLQTLNNLGDWSSVKTSEMHDASDLHYGSTVTLSDSSSCSYTITDADLFDDFEPTIDFPDPFRKSNQLHSNDFYRIKHSGGPLKIDLNYTTLGTAPADLDLYLYEESYELGNSETMAGFSQKQIGLGVTSAEETIDIENLEAGEYMLNINLYTGQAYLKNTISKERDTLMEPGIYQITVNGMNLCINQ